MPVELRIPGSTAAARMLTSVGSGLTATIEGWGCGFCEHATHHATAAPRRFTSVADVFRKLPPAGCLAERRRVGGRDTTNGRTTKGQRVDHFLIPRSASTHGPV